MISAFLLFLSATGLGQSCRHCPLIRLHYDSIVCPCHTRQSSLRLIPGTEPTRTLPTCRHQWLSYGTPSRINDRHRQGREVNKSLLFWDFLASVAIHVIMLALLSLLALLQRNNTCHAIMLALTCLLQCLLCNNTFTAITACLQYMQAVITLL